MEKTTQLRPEKFIAISQLYLKHLYSVVSAMYIANMTNDCKQAFAPRDKLLKERIHTLIDYLGTNSILSFINKDSLLLGNSGTKTFPAWIYTGELSEDSMAQANDELLEGKEEAVYNMIKKVFNVSQRADVTFKKDSSHLSIARALAHMMVIDALAGSREQHHLEFNHELNTGYAIAVKHRTMIMPLYFDDTILSEPQISDILKTAVGMKAVKDGKVWIIDPMPSYNLDHLYVGRP